jgi:hypothetical protein
LPAGDASNDPIASIATAMSNEEAADLDLVTVTPAVLARLWAG